MKQITLTSDEVTISFDTEVDKHYHISLRGAITKCLKHLYRYNEFHMPKDIMATILLTALKGDACKEDHFDIAQRRALYEYLKDKKTDNPYIEQFMKETRGRMI